MSMYDPLGSEAAAPTWGSPTHSRSPSPEAPRRSAPLPPAPLITDKIPQIYGQPEPGLITPQNSAVNGERLERPDQYLRVRITALDRNKKDILIRLDAQTNLPNFSGQTYRNISRSYGEFQRFAETIIISCPQTIVPALPLAQTSAPSDEEDDRLVKHAIQKWITRICENPVILQDEELRSFIESDFGYQPNVRIKKKSTGGALSILRRNVPDDDKDLANARLDLTRLEMQFSETAKAMDKLSKAKKALAAAYSELGTKLISVATAEQHQGLATAERKFGRVWHAAGDIINSEAAAECVILGDSLGYQGMNARSAKETLIQRTQVLEEYQSAVKNTIAKRRAIERLRASSNIRPDKVDEAVEELDEATKQEDMLSKRVHGMGQNLHQALATHSRHAHEDVTLSLAEHARANILYERQVLRELETLRPDLRAITKKPIPAPVIAPPPTNGASVVPTPTVVPQTAPLASSSSVHQQRPYPASGSQTGPMSGQFTSQQPTPTQPIYSPLPGPSTSDPLSASPRPGASRVNVLARSVQIEKPRLDPREAASKLANFL
ncbi:hypothetical protein DACRYDRAFT_74130 [Dacryopinax primogenitus]|uniref:PX domain-containing protein n=1 Tax=Dacryopinax primogenitus (strain DJM 731) TaxID=1858805 RepID=M5GD49_DACPD|nr:uncharacterized protein DACRYDRAFT_74130 [Dacryopinax primogenitus]EJU06605.1 hypothetical protein DACRYDRAFT_74130 [Dacryopinax primogenitus]